MQDVNPLETFELQRTGMLNAHIEFVVTELNLVWRGGIPGSATFGRCGRLSGDRWWRRCPSHPWTRLADALSEPLPGR